MFVEYCFRILQYDVCTDVIFKISVLFIMPFCTLIYILCPSLWWIVFGILFLHCPECIDLIVMVYSVVTDSRKRTCICSSYSKYSLRTGGIINLIFHSFHASRCLRRLHWRKSSLIIDLGLSFCLIANNCCWLEFALSFPSCVLCTLGCINSQLSVESWRNKK